MAASDWSERTRMLITVGIGVVVNIVLGYFLYSASSKYGELEKKNKAKMQEADNLRKEVAEGVPLDMKLKRLQRDLKKKESLLPDIRDPEAFRQAVSERALQSGVLLLSMAAAGMPVTESGPGASYEKTTYRMRAQGDFMSWCKLLNSMEENFPRFIAFENLVLTPTNNGAVPMGAKHEISVDVIVYRYVRQPGT